jgi:hypothetical protein
VIELNEGEMLADKFWLNPDSKMIWVKDNHIKTIVENPILFEYDGKEDFDKLLEWYLILFGKAAMKYSSVDNFYEKANDCTTSRSLGIFEYHVYQKGFVWCEYNDAAKILTIRTSSMVMAKEAIDDLKEHLEDFDEIHINIFRIDGTVTKNRLVGNNEIKFFLQEMILPRKAKYVNPRNVNLQMGSIRTVKPSTKISFLGKVKRFINKIYA